MREEELDVFEIYVAPPKKVVSIKLDVDIIHEMDRLWRSLGYKSRSEFIREAILYYMQVVKKTHERLESSGARRREFRRKLEEKLEELEEALEELTI